MIPKVLHYCWFSPDEGQSRFLRRPPMKPWSLTHYVCLRSAIERIRPIDVKFYCDDEPSGPWWDLSRRLVAVHKVTAPREVFGNALAHPAHRADVVRIERLLFEGGIYLDVDVFVHKSFDDLLNNSTVMGEQCIDGKVRGLCNAVILAEPGSPFLTRWRSAYRSFRSKGVDEFWDEHSVRIPYALSQQFRNEITTLPDSVFFWPTFSHDDLTLLFASTQSLDLSHTYATHLWENIAWDPYLQDLTPGRVRAVGTNFHSWVRPMLETLPDNYGRSPAPLRLARGLRKLARRARAVLVARVAQPHRANV